LSSVADIVPLVPPSVLFHEKLTGAPPGATEPLPVPIDVHALSAIPAHNRVDSTTPRAPACVDVSNGDPFLSMMILS
jgi:hypothetical protein